MLKSMFDHHESYSTLRQHIGLQSPECRGIYEPSAGLIILRESDSANKSPLSRLSPVLQHELYHTRQLPSTTAGLVVMSLLSQRTAIFERFTSKLNSDFQAGLWVPIKGWLDDLNTDNPNDWYDLHKPYYYVSFMKRNIGIIDSLLLSLGVFESNNVADCAYWEARFAWSNLFQDNSWKWCFARSALGNGWWPYGLTSLYEASALYFESLQQTGSVLEANNIIDQNLQSLRKNIGEESFRQSSKITYFGPFLAVERMGISPPPFHLVPIAAFWAMNAPLPHLQISDAIKGRQNEKDFPWTEVDPGNLFETMLFEIADDLGTSIPSCSLRDLASRWRPFFRGKSLGEVSTVNEIIEQDIEYIDRIKQHGAQSGTSFSVAFSCVSIPKTVDERLEAFFTFPPKLQPNEAIAIASSGVPLPPSANLESYALHLLAQHLIPLWSFRSLPRFRFGQPFVCPAIFNPLRHLCHDSAACNGHFPGTHTFLPDCWLQNVLHKFLSLDLQRLNIVPGEYSSEDEVRSHDW